MEGSGRIDDNVNVGALVSAVVSCIPDIGDVDLCFLLGTLGGDGSALSRRLFNGSISMLRSNVGVGSEVDGFLRTGELAEPGHELGDAALCEFCPGALSVR